MEVTYGRILLVGMIFTICSRGLSHFFYGLHRPRVVMISALIANVINVPATIVLVFGFWGLPAMGIAGAAIGTVIGSFVEVLIPVALFLSPRYERLYGTRRAWRPKLAPMRDIWRIGWPAGAMFGNEIVCWWIFMSGLIATFGVAHNAAGWIVLRYMHVSFMPAVGLSIAVTAVVGRQIGRGRRDLVAPRTWLGLGLTMAYMGTCALAFVLFREPLVGLFATETVSPELAPEVIRIGSQLLILAAAFQVFDAMAITLSGALRGAGDTVWPGVATMVCSWGLIIGGGKLLIEVAPGLESLGPWIGAATYIIVLSLLFLWRFVGGAWRKIDLVDAPPSVAALAGEGVLPELPGLDVPDLEEEERVEEAGAAS
jgi:MATE family multidrug resistance protein